MHFTCGIQKLLRTTLSPLLLFLSIQFCMCRICSYEWGVCLCKFTWPIKLQTKLTCFIQTFYLNYLHSRLHSFHFFGIFIFISYLKTSARTMLHFADILITNILIFMKLILTNHVQTLMRSWTSGIWPLLRFLTLELVKNMVRSNNGEL